MPGGVGFRPVIRANVASGAGKSKTPGGSRAAGIISRENREGP